jgi:hypothetical protein
VTPDAATVPLEELDSLWDFDDPASSERRFTQLLPRARAEQGGVFVTEVLTQLARALGLQGAFELAHSTLAEAERTLRPSDRRGRARLLLERGRLERSEHRADHGRSAFHEAWDVSRATGADALAVDAAHMLGIVEPDEEAARWNERAMELARSSPDPDARRWVGSLANNMGWARHEAGDDDGAIGLFTQSREAFLADGRVERGDVAKALEEQKALLTELAAHGKTDGYVLQEIAECLVELGREDEAQSFFVRARTALAGAQTEP